jgi:cytochrome P450
LHGSAAARAYLHFFRDPLRYLRESHAQHGAVHALARPFGLPVAPRRYVFAFGPEFNRVVLGDPLRFKSTGQTLPGPKGSAQRRLRYGLTRSHDERHERQRELVRPIFQRQAVEALLPRMVERCDEALAGWSVGAHIDIDAEMRALSLALSAELLFGSAEPARARRVGAGIGEWLERSFSPRVWLCMLDLPGTPYRAMLRHAAELEREILELLRERRSGAARNLAGEDVFSRLVAAHAAGEPWMDARDLVGQAAVLFAASFETTAHALGWLFLLLAQHPRISDAIGAEIDKELGAQAPRAAEVLARLPLLDAALRESLRILPAVPFTLRSVQADAALGGLELEKGDRVVLSHYITHHLPELYPEPRRFQPERWFGLRRSAYQYLPFSAGPRACIGFFFATLAMKVVALRVLQRFRLSLVAGTRIDPVVRVTAGPSQGLPAVLYAAGTALAPQPVVGSICEIIEFDREARSHA